MSLIPRPSIQTSSFALIASVARELFGARDWQDDENDPGFNPEQVDRWVIVSIIFIFILFITVVAGYTCVAYYRRSVIIGGGSNLESQDEYGHPLTPLTPPAIPALPSPTRPGPSRSQ